jgi:hypothetical protein
MFEASPTYGQTFMVPDNAPFLQSIGFVIRNPLGNASIKFRAYVYQWLNGTVGQAVFTSPVQTIPPAADWQAVVVGVPQLRLETDRQYVVLYTTVGAGNTQTAATKWGFMQQPPGTLAYASGTFVFSNSLVFPPALSAWRIGSGDLAFALTFIGDPDEIGIPTLSIGATVLLGIALASAGVVCVCRRQASA